MTSRNRCRGWSLVASRDHLTGPERDAANAHLELCRSCRDRLEDRDAAHGLIRSVTAAAGGVAAADVAVAGVMAAGSGAGGLAGLAGAIGAAPWAATIVGGAIAVVATAGGVTVAGRTHPPARPASAVQHHEKAPVDRGTGGHPTVKPAPTTDPSAPASTLVPQLPTVPVPVPSLPAVGTSPLPLPSSVAGVPLAPLPVAGSVLPTTIPRLPLPTGLAIPTVP